MTSYAVLLRAVNLAGHNRVAMADLRAVLESLGHQDVGTYLQSGNAVFTSSRRGAGRLERQIETALERRLGGHIDVLLRTGAELAAVVEANPFPAAAATPTSLHVAFLAQRPTPAQRSAVEQADHGPDELAFGDRAVYLHYTSGSQRSRLGPALARLKGVATTRNWNTVLALAERTAEAPGRRR